MCGLVCLSRTSERGGKGDCVKEGGGEEGERERERAALGGRLTTPKSSILGLISNAAALAAVSLTLLFKPWYKAARRKGTWFELRCDGILGAL